MGCSDLRVPCQRQAGKVLILITLEQPYTETTWAELTTSVNKLKARFDINPSDYATYDPIAWSKETTKVGDENAYKGKLAVNLAPIFDIAY